MIHSLLLTSSGLDRVTDWVVANHTHMHILGVLIEPKRDRYLVLLDCSARDATFLSLLEH